jgi:hypothetical protein
MPKSYSKYLHTNSKTGDNPTHQTNPAWVVTFVRWAERGRGGTPDQLSSRINKKNDPFETKDILVVDSDCIAISTTDSKSSPTPAAQITLKMGRYNYLTAIAPGDYVFVNIVDFQSKADDIAKRAAAGQQINGEHDGFKGVYKVQSVRRIFSIDPNTGTSINQCIIQAHGFTELNNTIYFNPHLINRNELKNDFLYISNLADGLKDPKLYTGKNNVQILIATIFNLFVGQGLGDKNKVKKNYVEKQPPKLELTPNLHFVVPNKVGSLLGNSNAKSVKDVYNLIFGKQEYGVGWSEDSEDYKGMNPINFSSSNFGARVYFPKESKYCEGFGFLRPDSFQQTTVYSLMQSYLNSPINELYTTFRISPNGNGVMPTLIMRQVPFASDSYYDASATKFSNLPRWELDHSMIYNMNMGREEAARFNFVQFFGRVNLVAKPDAEISRQIAQVNYISDKSDIMKNGLRPFITVSNFDLAAGDAYKSTKWKSLMSDILIGGHLKLNGSITTVGIEEPIPCGDNLQISDMIFHIESVSHMCSVTPLGTREFKTTLELSHGVLADENDKLKSYPEMSKSNIDVFNKDLWLHDLSPITINDSFGIPTQQNIDFSQKSSLVVKPDTKKQTKKRITRK